MTNEDLPEEVPTGPTDAKAAASSEPKSKGDVSWVKVLKHSVALAKALTWPTLVAAILFIYREPVREVVDQVPDLVAHAQKFSAGSFAMEMQTQAQQTGGTQLAGVVTKLNADDVQDLLRIGCGPWSLFGSDSNPNRFSVPAAAAYERLRRLESMEIVQFKLDEKIIPIKQVDFLIHQLPKKQVKEGSNSEFTMYQISDRATDGEKQILKAQYELTSLGRDAFGSIIGAVTAQLPGKQRHHRQVGCPAGKN